MSRSWRFVAQAKALLNRSATSQVSQQQSQASCSSVGKQQHSSTGPYIASWQQSFAKHAEFEPNSQNLSKVALARGFGAAGGVVFVLGCNVASSKVPEVDLTEIVPEWLRNTFSNKAHAQEQQLTASASYSSSSQVLGPHYIANAAALAAPAVVNITITQDGLPIPQDQSGTGFIFNSNGSILTNAHVVAEALVERSNSHQSASSSKDGEDSKPITVALQDGRIFQGSVVMFDRISDLAVIQISSSQPLPIVKLGTSKGLRVGEWVVALGSPLHLQNSVTAGIISCVDRKAADLGLSRVCSEYIQTDAAINRGNSGGPLVNLQGEVIGLACFKALSADGVSFAIPIDTAKDVIQQLQQRGRVVRPYIGIKMLQLNEHNVTQMREKDAAFPDVSQGILVPHVAAASPAAKCGLMEGDVITGFAGQDKTLSTSHLIQCLGQHVNDKMEVQILRPSVGKKVLQIHVSEALQ